MDYQRFDWSQRTFARIKLIEFRDRGEHSGCASRAYSISNLYLL